MIENQAAVFFYPAPASALLNTEYDIGIFRVHLRRELKQAFRFLFKIAVDQEYALTAGMGKASHHCLVVAKIPR